MVAHICVCICTFKRPQLLRELLGAILRQYTNGEFEFSVVISDNDVEQSARGIVDSVANGQPISITYCVEPIQNIARARNKAVECSKGDYLAFIDDDEVPERDWLLQALRVCRQFGSAGVLAPVRPLFANQPPAWVVRGRFFERPEHQTGQVLKWREARTGNVLVKREIVVALVEPFRPRFGNGGEDQDFFRRLMERGHIFIWCGTAGVLEHVPEDRCTRRYLLKRALQRGQAERELTDVHGVVKSLVAVPLYTILLPFLLLAGHHHFMSLSVRLCDHAGKLMGVIGLRPVGDKYVQGV